MVKYCSAFGCKNSALTPEISFFQFPKDPILRKKWIIKTNRANFKPGSSAVLCSDHFLETDMELSTCHSFLRSLSIPEERIKCVKPRLVPGAIPSRFKHNNNDALAVLHKSSSSSSKSIKKRGAFAKRERLRVLSEIDFSTTPSLPDEDNDFATLNSDFENEKKSEDGDNFKLINPGNDSQQWMSDISSWISQGDEIKLCEQDVDAVVMEAFELQETESTMSTMPLVQDSEYSVQIITPPPSFEHDYIIPMDAALEKNKEHKNPPEKVQQLEHYSLNRFCLERFSNNDKLIKFYTGFSNYRTLKNFFLSIESYSYIPEITKWNQQEEPQTDCSNPLDTGLQPIDQLFMFLNKLRLGSYDQDLADKFVVTTKTVSRITFTWANILYFILGSQPLWPSQQRVQKLMPKCFKKAHPKTRVIIDTIKIVVKTPTRGSLSREFYSKSKGSATVKGLIGFTPGGAVCFVSNLYPGSISDNSLVSNSGILDFLEEGGEVMASKDFQISDLIKDKKCTLVMPNVLSSNSMVRHKAIHSKNTADIQIYLDKAICLKQFRLFDSAFPFSMLELVNQLWTVACLITNFQHSSTTFNRED